MLTDLTESLLPAALACWEAHRARSPLPPPQAGWARPLAERRAIVEARLRAALRAERNDVWARAVVAGDAVAAYLVGRYRQLPRNTPYRTYAPDRFLGIGADDWAVAGAAPPGPPDPGGEGAGRRRAAVADGSATGGSAGTGSSPPGSGGPGGAALVDLYADLALWGVARGADAHQLAIPEGDDRTELWLDLGFARHDCYALLPIDEGRSLDVAVTGWTTRRVGPGRPDVRTEDALDGFALGEARTHHRSPVFTFAPPGFEAAIRRALRESLDDPDALVILAERDGRPAGYLSGFLLPDLPFWAPPAVPTPCAFIASAYVDPPARHRGGLRALVAETARLAAGRGARALFTTYLPANLLAALAWRRLGFRPLQTVHQRRLDPRATARLRRAARVAGLKV